MQHPPTKRIINMKKLIVFIAFIVSAVCAYSKTSQVDSIAAIQPDGASGISNQNRQSVFPALMNDAYKNTPEWGKYKALRAVGWTTFGVGIAATGVGTIVGLALGSIHGPNTDKTQAGSIIVYSGLGLTAASIPILISAYHYRNKAKKIGMSMGLTQLAAPTFGQNMSYTPAVNFAVTF